MKGCMAIGSRMKRILVTGVNGQLGHDVMNELARHGLEGIGSDITETYKGSDGSPVCSMPYMQLDITRREDVLRLIAELSPDAVIHAAAWTAVDAAEDEENIAKVYAINADGTKNIADACKNVGATMMYISTDYVFDGKGDKPWKPDCKDYSPINVYGKSKLEGELAVSSILDKYFIVRIAWVFGINGKNFIKTMLKLSETHNTISVVNDQIGTPTYTYDLAHLLVAMIQSNKYGYYHATNEGGYISWYDFAVEIFKQSGKNVDVRPVSTAEYGQSKARRPFNSRLDKSKLVENGFELLPDWKDALMRFLIEGRCLWDK